MTDVELISEYRGAEIGTIKMKRFPHSGRPNLQMDLSLSGGFQIVQD
jgi:hypothetical protein